MELKDFQEEFLALKKDLSSFIFRITGHLQDTEDLLQDTYLRAAKSIHTFQGKSSLKTWVFTIATNITKDHFRGKKRWTTNCMINASDDAKNNPELMEKMINISKGGNEAGKFEIKEHINFCFTCMAKTLPVEQQVAVILKDVYGFKISEITVILGLSEGKVKHAISGGRETLLDIFEHKCALVSKKGVCYQCSELNGILNPKQDQQKELMKIKMVRDANKGKTKEELYKLRAELVKNIDPLHSNSTHLHTYFLSLMPHYSENKKLETL
jgi:RNA polymerase sigma-70 factor, ECF subfamily